MFLNVGDGSGIAYAEADRHFSRTVNTGNGTEGSYGSVVTGIKVTGPSSPDDVTGQAEASNGL
jgi:predicted metal-binding transcription factor (methanogenesis marker protein 9)